VGTEMDVQVARALESLVAASELAGFKAGTWKDNISPYLDGP